MRNTLTILCVLTACLNVASTASAQKSYPMLMGLTPNSAQIGQTSTCTVKSRYDLSQTLSVWVEGTGVTAVPQFPELKEGETRKEATTLKLRFTVDADASPGPREFRLSTANGASTVGQIVIVRDPIVQEQDKNNTREEARLVTLPATLCGAIEKNEDVDYFKFQAEAGQTFCFHVRSQRLQDKIHDLQTHSDPLISLRNASGSTIAMSDNEFNGDPFLCYEFKQAGEYFLEIRDVRYQGNSYWEYAVEVNSRPFVRNVFPLGVTAGQPATLTLVGDHLPAEHAIPWTAPTDAHGIQKVRLPLGDDLTDPVSVMVTDLPTVLETDQPNDTRETAQPVSFPVAINGRIGQESDLDYFKLTLKNGDALTIDLHAARLESQLDSIA